MKYAIDGNNVLLGLRLNKKPSQRLFARLIHALRARGDEVRIFFDNSIERHMSEHGLQAEWRALRTALDRSASPPTFVPHADTAISAHCAATSAAVINAGDNMDSWKVRPKVVHRARASRTQGKVRLTLQGDARGELVLDVSAHEPFELEGLRFPILGDSTGAVEPIVAPDGEYAETHAAEGTLLVLALDASISMKSSNSFDGRPKKDHLNEIVKKALARLRESEIAEGLYIAILRFENDVTLLPGPGGAAFVSVNDWYEKLPDFDYLKGISHGQTNIRLALQRSKELIQSAIADDAIKDLAENWRAAVILITDGMHYVQRADGSKETDVDVAPEAIAIHEGLSGLINSKVDVGCVGIGNDINRDLLGNIASPCTPLQRHMASLASIAHFLVGDRLFIAVDSNDSGFVDAIRTFIDIASASASRRGRG